MDIDLLKILIPITVLLNIIVSILIIKRDDLDGFQKKSQIVITWLIPIVAALGFYFINRNHDVLERNKNSFHGGKATSMNHGVSSTSEGSIND